MEKEIRPCESQAERCTGVSRRAFIGGAVAGAALYATGKAAAAQVAGEGGAKGSEIVVAKGDDPAAMVRAAMDAYGGMGRFVKKGDVVLVKPNIAFDRVPEQAGCTNPEVVGELVRMCLKAGASKVKVYDRTVNPAKNRIFTRLAQSRFSSASRSMASSTAKSSSSRASVAISIFSGSIRRS